VARSVRRFWGEIETRSGDEEIALVECASSIESQHAPSCRGREDPKSAELKKPGGASHMLRREALLTGRYMRGRRFVSVGGDLFGHRSQLAKVLVPLQFIQNVRLESGGHILKPGT